MVINRVVNHYYPLLTIINHYYPFLSMNPQEIAGTIGLKGRCTSFGQALMPNLFGRGGDLMT